MTPNSLPFFLLALSSVLSAPQPYDGYTQVVVPQKRAALVLDRLLIALQKALHEGAAPDRDGPRAAPLRIPMLDDSDVIGSSEEEALMPAARAPEFEPRTAPLRLAALGDNTSSLQRRGQGGGRGRVLRCYFNAVTCF